MPVQLTSEEGLSETAEKARKRLSNGSFDCQPFLKFLSFRSLVAVSNWKYYTNKTFTGHSQKPQSLEHTVH